MKCFHQQLPFGIAQQELYDIAEKPKHMNSSGDLKHYQNNHTLNKNDSESSKK